MGQLAFKKVGEKNKLFLKKITGRGSRVQKVRLHDLHT